MSKSTGRLADLRKKIDACDDAILSAVAERMAVVREIASEKLNSGNPLFDRSRESEVMARAESLARSKGLSTELARSLVRVLTDESQSIQLEVLSTKQSSDDSHQKILIVGGKGRMGERFKAEFLRRGVPVQVVDRGDSLTAPIVSGADIVFLSVPMSDATRIVREIAPLVRKDALLVDINSLKAELCEVMEKLCPGEVLGTHPMCGPTVKTFRRQKMILCPIRTGSRSKWLTTQFNQMGFECIESKPVEHDIMMARVQALTHLGKLAMGEAWRRSGLSPESTLPFTSPIYRLELAIVGRLFAQDAGLYAEIEMGNPHGAKSREDLKAATNELVEIIGSGDREAFTKYFDRIKDHLKGFSPVAMKLSDELIEYLVSLP